MLTKRQEVVIADISYAKSGFGVTQEGQHVFFNKKLVLNLDLKQGDEVLAQVIENYDDKKSVCKYRAIRAEKIYEGKQEANQWSDKNTLDCMEEGDLWTIKELAHELKQEEKHIEQLIERNPSVIKVDAYIKIRE
jgi:hypothetical protein|tara:strand:+ start:760 stop:1164 length:405 start_codon:yes stop_codon:yes gene_type:complete